MTRDFNKQRRDDMRPSSRHTPSDNYREERPFKSARPRLSRDTVDRAWENGATQKYADYQPRHNASRPPFQQQGRPAPGAEPYRSSQSRPGYPTRQQNYRGSSPSTHERYPRRAQQPEGERRPFNETEYRRFSSTPDSGYQPRHEQMPPADGPRFNRPGGYRASGGPRDYNNERRTYDQRGPSQPYRGGEKRYQEPRSPRFEQRGPGTPARNISRSATGPRDFRSGERERDNFARRNRSDGPQARRDNHNPRWQSRPAAQRGYRSAQHEGPYGQRERSYTRPEAEQFEGDYERFNAYQDRQPLAQPEQVEEKHVTRLPDGRVLKGSRPSQRKQAHFWNGIEAEASTLMPVPEVPAQVAKPAPSKEPVEKPAKPKTPPTAKPKALKTTRADYSRGTGGMKSIHGSKARALKKKRQGPQGPGTRPSQRGYKWPTPGE